MRIKTITLNCFIGLCFLVFSSASVLGFAWPQSVTYSDLSRSGQSYALVMDPDSAQPNLISGYNWYPSPSLYVSRTSQVWDETLGFWDNSQGYWTEGDWRLVKVYTNIDCDGPWDSLLEYYNNQEPEFDESGNPLPPLDPVEVETYRWFPPVFIPEPTWVAVPGWRSVTDLVEQKTYELVYGMMTIDPVSGVLNFIKFSQLYVVDEYGVSSLLDETEFQVNSLQVDPYSGVFSNHDFCFSYDSEYKLDNYPFYLVSNWEFVEHKFTLDIEIKPPAASDLAPYYVAGNKVHQELTLSYNRITGETVKESEQFIVGSTKAPQSALISIPLNAVTFNFNGVLVSGLLNGYIAPYVMPTLTVWETIQGVGSGTQGFMVNDSTVDVFLAGTATTGLNYLSTAVDSSIDWDYTMFVSDLSADILHGQIQGAHKQYPSYILKCDGVIVDSFNQGGAGVLGLNSSIAPLFPVNVSF
jgi:hypothetical protein